MAGQFDYIVFTYNDGHDLNRPSVIQVKDVGAYLRTMEVTGEYYANAYAVTEGKLIPLTVTGKQSPGDGDYFRVDVSFIRTDNDKLYANVHYYVDGRG